MHTPCFRKKNIDSYYWL